MGVKINVGYCQKVGLPNYGSEGAHCNLEIEVDSALFNDAVAFQNRMQEFYAACRSAVESQLQQDRNVSQTPEKQAHSQSSDATARNTSSHSVRRDGVPQTAHAVQLTLYSLLLQGNGYEKVETEIRQLVKTKRPKICSHHFATRNKRQTDRFFALCREYLDSLDRGVFNYRPCWSCSMCDYRHLCDG